MQLPISYFFRFFFMPNFTFLTFKIYYRYLFLGLYLFFFASISIPLLPAPVSFLSTFLHPYFSFPLLLAPLPFIHPLPHPLFCKPLLYLLFTPLSLSLLSLLLARLYLLLFAPISCSLLPLPLGLQESLSVPRKPPTTANEPFVVLTGRPATPSLSFPSLRTLIESPPNS